MVSSVLTITNRRRRVAAWAARPASWICLIGLYGLLDSHAQAWAQGTFLPGTRPMGMGGAMRGLATGDAGPMLNPSGISLIRAYSLECGYQYGRTLDSHDMRISAVDSTSGFNIGGALYYAYHNDSPLDGVSQSGHIGGGSLSFPFLEKFFVGASVKYMTFRDAASVKHSGVTVDAGITIRPMPQLAVGAAGYNLLKVATSWVPLGVGGGAAVSPMPRLIFTLDAVWTKVYDDPTRDHLLSYMGGGEYSLADTAAVRVGGGRDGLTKNGYVTGGVTMLSAQLGAIDLGVRQDVSGATKDTFLGATLRLFVPSM